MKESCVDPLGNDTNIATSDRRELYIDDNPPHLVALGRVSEDSKIVHNVPLGNDKDKQEHLDCVCAAGAGVMTRQYFEPASPGFRTSKSTSPKESDRIMQNLKEEIIQDIRDKLEQSITEKLTRQLNLAFSQLQSQMQSQGIIPLIELEVAHSTTRVSTKESCVDPLGNDTDIATSDRRELYIDDNPPHLVALGRVSEDSKIVHNVPLGNDKDKQEAKRPTKLVDRLEPDDEPIYQMALMIPKLFLKPMQVSWDASMFGMYNDNGPLYIKHEDLLEILHGGQCLNIVVIQLWIMYMNELSLRSEDASMYGFVEPQFIQRSMQSQFESENYIKKWMQNSERHIYLGAYLNGGHWQLVVICPKDNVVVWFCSLHNKPDRCLKGIINSALKGLNNNQGSKFKATAKWIQVKCNKQKGSTECGYYVMHWMSTIVLGGFKDNWEMYFTDSRPLEPDRIKVIRIQWARYFLRVKNEVLGL